MYRSFVPDHISRMAQVHRALVMSLVVVCIAGIGVIGALSAMTVVHW
jgi:hypothetical protein